MKAMGTFILILVASVVGFLALGALGFVSALRPIRIVSDETPASLGWHYQELTLVTEDGISLAAWYVPAEGKGLEDPADAAIIVLHGYGYDKGNVLPVTPFLHTHFPLLLIDFRYFGRSQGSISTAGYREGKDLLAGIVYLKGRGIKRVGVFGFSLGASVALMSLPAAPEVGAVVADSAYADLEVMANAFYRNLYILKYPLAAVTSGLARAVFGKSLKDISAVKAVAATQVPILLIHSSKDDQIGVENFFLLQKQLEARPNSQSWLVDDATHGLIHFLHQAEYERRVLRFFLEHLLDED